MSADPGLFALKGALRAAIVVPVAFAISLEAIGDTQMALFAAFGSMALLVFVDFGGSRAARLRAYLVLVAAGMGLIALGTLCSKTPWLATVAMAVVAFAVLFAGVLNDYIAAAHSGALLTFVLPVMVPADVDALPMRLAGWGLAGALSIAATMLLWPARPREALRQTAGRTASALAALVQARSGEQTVAAAMADDDAREATAEVRRRFLALAHRPSGTASRTAALARLTEDLGWLHAVAARDSRLANTQTRLRAERIEIEAAVPDALRAIAARLDLGEESGAEGETQAARHALARVDDAHEQLGHALMRDAEGWCDELEEEVATVELDEAFRLRQLTFATLQTGRDALLACGEQVCEDPLRTRRARIDATGRLVRTHASMQSVWLRNSLRGAAGLTVAVLIGQISDLQHSFWIVLGTMSVLRSNALATGSTIAEALLGTLGGIVVGGLLVAAVGGDQAALWAILPPAVLVAAYAPRAISFAAGQGAFSLVVLVLFNLLQPAGWKVGLVRIEDVAIGAGVSLLAGVLIWPRGAGAVLRDALGAVYGRSAAYLDVTIGALLGGDDGSPANSTVQAAREASAAAQLLDATARDYLAERGSPRGSVDDLTVLIAGATRARRIAGLMQSAHTFARLAPVDARLHRLVLARDAFEHERRELCDWYARLGDSLSQAGTAASQLPEPDSREASAPAPAPAPAADAAQGVADGEPSRRDADGGPAGVEPSRGDADRDRDAALATVVLERAESVAGLPPGLAIAWAHRHLMSLAEMEPALARACERMVGRVGAPADHDAS